MDDDHTDESICNPAEAQAPSNQNAERVPPTLVALYKELIDEEHVSEPDEFLISHRDWYIPDVRLDVIEKLVLPSSDLQTREDQKTVWSHFEIIVVKQEGMAARQDGLERPTTPRLQRPLRLHWRLFLKALGYGIHFVPPWAMMPPNKRTERAEQVRQLLQKLRNLIDETGYDVSVYGLLRTDERFSENVPVSLLSRNYALVDLKRLQSSLADSADGQDILANLKSTLEGPKIVAPMPLNDFYFRAFRTLREPKSLWRFLRALERDFLATVKPKSWEPARPGKENFRRTYLVKYLASHFREEYNQRTPPGTLIAAIGRLYFGDSSFTESHVSHILHGKSRAKKRRATPSASASNLPLDPTVSPVLAIQDLRRFATSGDRTKPSESKEE